MNKRRERDLMKIKYSIIIPTLSILLITAIVVPLVVFLPDKDSNGYVSSYGVYDNSAASQYVGENISTYFGTYSPQDLDYNPSIIPSKIESDLSNVDFQGLSIDSSLYETLANYGFAIVDEGYTSIYKIYEWFKADPYFITTDLCLHTFHWLYDDSLKLLELMYLYELYKDLITNLRADQISLNSTITEPIVQEALKKNIAYLTVVLYLLDNTTSIPSEVESMVNTELANIVAETQASSAILEYQENFAQYKVRGHYTGNETLESYFQALMYSGRMGYLISESAVEQTLMTLLLCSSFDNSSLQDLWFQIYEPTTFYVGQTLDLTPFEMYNIWVSFGSPQSDQLANNTLVEETISFARNYAIERENILNVESIFPSPERPITFKIMGQRLTPDYYTFQNLLHPIVDSRNFPQTLDFFSVLGSIRAEGLLQSENDTYPYYGEQILNLRDEFGSLDSEVWVQNLYWMWIYTLFPLLQTPSEGYPGFMLNHAWINKELMTTLGSFAELKHDSLLYGYSGYVSPAVFPDYGYVEPYPEIYGRLVSMLEMLKDGLDARGLISARLKDRIERCLEVFEYLTDISIKILNNEELTSDDLQDILYTGKRLYEIVVDMIPGSSYVDSSLTPMAVIADISTDDLVTGHTKEIAVGNPLVIYVIVQDYDGNLYLTKGGTYSYYEFTVPKNEIMNDEEWRMLLESDPPEMPDWILDIETVLIESSNILLTVIIRSKEKLLRFYS